MDCWNSKVYTADEGGTVMELVRIDLILSKLQISKPTYHRLFRYGILPGPAQKVTVKGRRGYHYLYHEGDFMEAWHQYGENKRRGLSVKDMGEQMERKRARGDFTPRTKEQAVNALLGRLTPKDGESLEEFESRYESERTALWKKELPELADLVKTPQE
jgi:hypothetical protein